MTFYFNTFFSHSLAMDVMKTNFLHKETFGFQWNLIKKKRIRM